MIKLKKWCINFIEPPRDDRKYTRMELVDPEPGDSKENLGYFIPAEKLEALVKIVEGLKAPDVKMVDYGYTLDFLIGAIEQLCEGEEK